MKRDLDAIRAILQALEDQGDVRGINAKHVEGYDADVVNYNAALLIEAGFVHGSVSRTIGKSSPAPVHARQMTWNGHELHDAIRSPEIFQKVKDAFAATGSWSFAALLSVAQGIIAKLATKAAGLE
tara:strand:+ start:270 stop:647 length:378 start_codon:yes stop_codon:yes gene_type:complete